MVAHYGSYNFVPKKTKGTVQIVLAYRNEWPRWTDYWFYLACALTRMSLKLDE
jgi:hypothetical protein